MDTENQAKLADVLEGQNDLNRSIARALQALALQSDRYDTELESLRRELGDLRLVLTTYMESISRQRRREPE